MSNTSDIRLGSCLCTAVQYSLNGDPFHYLLCHCNNCKKSSGSAFQAHSCWKHDQFKLIKGEDSIRHFEDKDTKSSRILTRSFCINCGSSLFEKVQDADFLLVHPFTIEGLDNWKPNREVFEEFRADWLKDIAFLPESPKL